MRVFACKDLDGDCQVIRGKVEPQDPSDFHCRGGEFVMLDSQAEHYCSTLTPGTFRELKRLDVVSGEFEFVEEVKVPTLREAWEAYKLDYPHVVQNSKSHDIESWKYLVLALERELSKPAPRYDEKLIDELLEIGENVVGHFYLLLMPGRTWSEIPNRRAAEILQALKRAKEEV